MSLIAIIIVVVAVVLLALAVLQFRGRTRAAKERRQMRKNEILQDRQRQQVNN